MIIKELLLDGFGKFGRKHIKFYNGINLIVADNESGKTTVRKSIESAFYGFTNTDSKRKNYTDDYINYRSGNYRVKLNLLDKTKNISIERDLLNEYTKVYEDGNDKTSDYSYTNKILTPGFELLGIGSIVYKNFFDIESNSVVDNQIINNILNIENNSYFINKILEIADKERLEIGSLNAPTKKRALLNIKIEEKLNIIKEYDKIEKDIKNLKILIEKQNVKTDIKKKSILFEIIFLFFLTSLLFVRTSFPMLYFIPLILIILNLIRIYNIIKYNKYLELNKNDKDNEEFILGQISILEKYMDKKIEDIDELNKLKSDLKRLDYEYKLLTDAINIVQNANKKISTSPINKYILRAKNIFKYITNSDDLSIDEDFNMYLERDFRLCFNQMSKATQEIVNFCIKISCRQFILDNGFIILDDAFQYLDDKRLYRTIKYLSNLSERYQIIIFTSNNRIKDILDKNSYKYNMVEF